MRNALRRPSTYVALCAIVVLSVFVARGDLRVTDAPKPERTVSAPPVRVLRAPQARSVRGAEAIVTGRLFDCGGAPVANLPLRRGDAVCATTDAAGAFRVPTADAFVDLLVGGGEFAPRLLRASVVAPEPLCARLAPAAPWDEAPTPPPAPVLTGEGSVRSAAGTPVAGAYVTAVGLGVWSRTDEIGRYTLPLWDSEPVLVMQRPGDDDGALVARSEPTRLSRTRGVVPLPELIAEPGVTLRGTLLDTAGAPVEGAPVAIEGEGVSRLCETGTSGRFHISGLLRGRYAVRPLGWRGAIGRAHEVVVEQHTADCRLVLEPVQKRRIQVCSESGAPVGNAYVAVLVDGARSDVARADDAGWAEVDTVSGQMDFEVRSGADGRLAHSVRAFESDRSRLVVALP
ncbi:MAG: carboxypeptidase-like regulatory domain-containing protein [Planctomycetota bacterium]